MPERQWPKYIDDPETWSDRASQDPQWVADCLSRIGRFGGQHKRASVLSHSLNVFERLSDEPVQVQLWGLYHDAHEILTGDIPRKFKTTDAIRYQQYCDALLQEKLGILVTEKIVELIDVWTGDAEHEYWDEYCSVWSHRPVEFQIDAFVSRSNLLKGFLK